MTYGPSETGCSVQCRQLQELLQRCPPRSARLVLQQMTRQASKNLDEGTTVMLMNKELVTVVTLMFFHSLRKYNEGRVTKNKVEH